MLFNNVVLLNGVLIPEILNNPLAFWFLTDLAFLLPHMVHFEDDIVLKLLVFVSLGFVLFVFFFHIKQYNNIILYLRL